jgi:phosphoserine phosphatase
MKDNSKTVGNLRYPLVCFDLDGTLVDDTIYIWKTLHEVFATDPVARKTAYDDFFAERITYDQWFAHDLKLLRASGATKSRIQELIAGLRIMPGAKEVIAKLKSLGHRIAVVSGSLDIVVDELFEPGLFDHLLINRIRFAPDGTIEGGTPTPFDLEGKADGLAELAKREGIELSQTVFIGDNENDVWIAKAAGLSIAFNCKSEKLRQICRYEVVKKDLFQVAEILSSL